MTGNIFINYRRGDDKHFAGRLCDRLSESFSLDQLFIDVDSIAPGLDFVRVLEEQVARCDVLLAVIGRDWLGASDKSGHRRIDNPSDFVRIELEAALHHGKRVIPVLVGEAPMPREDELPDSLKPLARRNAVRLTHERFRAEVGALVRKLEEVLQEAEAARAAAAAGAVVRDTLPEQTTTSASPAPAVGRLEVAILTALVPLLFVGLFPMWWWSSAQYVKTLYVAVLAYGALAISALMYVLENRRSRRAWAAQSDSAFYAILMGLGCAWALAALVCSYGGDIGQFSTTTTVIVAVLVFATVSFALLRTGKSSWIVPFQMVSLVIGLMALFFSVRLLAISGVVREDVRYGVFHNIMSYGGLALFVIVATHAFGRGRDILQANAPVHGEPDHLLTRTQPMTFWLATFAGVVDGAVVMLVGYTAFEGSALGIHRAALLAGGMALLVAAIAAARGHRFAEHAAWGAAAILALGSLYAAIFNVVRFGRLGLETFEIAFLAVTLLGIPVLLGYVLTARRLHS